MLEGSQGQVEHQSAVGRNGARVAGVILGAVAQLVGDVDLPAVALVHVHEDGREAIDVGGILVGGGAVRGDGYKRLADAHLSGHHGLHVVVLGPCLLEDEAGGVGGRRQQMSLVVHKDSVAIDGRQGAGAFLLDMGDDVIGGAEVQRVLQRPLGQQLPRVVAGSDALGGLGVEVVEEFLVVLLPVGEFFDAVVLFRATDHDEREQRQQEPECSCQCLGDVFVHRRE